MMNRSRRRVKIARSANERFGFVSGGSMPTPGFFVAPGLSHRPAASVPIARMMQELSPEESVFDLPFVQSMAALSHAACGYRFSRSTAKPEQEKALADTRREHEHRVAVARLDEYDPGSTGLTKEQIRLLRSQITGDKEPDEWLARQGLARMFRGEIPGPREIESMPNGEHILSVLDTFEPGDGTIAIMKFAEPEPYGYQEIHAAYWIDRLVAHFEGDTN